MNLRIRQYTYEQNTSGEYQPRETGELIGLRTIEIAKPEIGDNFESRYQDNLREIGETFRVETDPVTGRKIEMAIVNQDASETVVFGSTQFSSLTTNTGNAIELAAHAAALPNIRRVYMAFPGNGGSSGMSLREQLRFARSGRFTVGLGTPESPFRPASTAIAFANTLARLGIQPDYLSGDESGARLVLGMMSAIDRDTVKEVYLNGPPGVSHKANYAVSMLYEDRQGRQKADNKVPIEESFPGQITDARVAQAVELMPTVYSGNEKKFRVLRTYAGAGRLLGYNMAFGGHDDLQKPTEHALLNDAIAGISRHQANVVMDFKTGSTIHDSLDCVRLGAAIMNGIDPVLRSDKRLVSVYLTEGSLDEHTQVPELRWATELQVFKGAISKMITLPGGLLAPKFSSLAIAKAS